MKIKALLASMAAVLMLGACTESEDTTPSMADNDRLETLIDKDIEKVVQFRDRYGTYLLYRFDQELDFAYQFEQASNWTSARLTTIGHDDASVAVDMLYDKLFSCYGDDYKTKFFPRKLLLVDGIESTGELGHSQPQMGQHRAVANLNSVTFARMSASSVSSLLADEMELYAQLGAMHQALLADYLVGARGEYPVGDDFFSFSLKDYATLMDPSRRNAAQIQAQDPTFFATHGFFFPEDDESTYFPSAEDDLLNYIRHMVTMDKTEADAIMEQTLMASKMHVLTVGLQQMGVDVLKINPWTEQFLLMEYVQPATMIAPGAVTDNENAVLKVTITKGSHALDRLVVSVNGSVQQTIDLSALERVRNVIEIKVGGLHQGSNPVVLSLYEQDREKAAAIVTTTVNYATMDEVLGFTIKSSADMEDVYRRIKVEEGSGYPVDNSQDENLTTISFEKHGWLDRYFMEQDCDYRAWKVYRSPQTGMATLIQCYERGFNENMTAVEYALTDTYAFTYNEDGELQQVTRQKVGSAAETIISDVVYVGGNITRYNCMGTTYETQYATANGITTRVDILDEALSGKCFGFTGKETLNPYYMPCIPAVIPGSVAGIPLQLLYSQYLHGSIDGVWNGGWSKNLEDMTNTATVTLGDETWNYIFKLK